LGKFYRGFIWKGGSIKDKNGIKGRNKGNFSFSLCKQGREGLKRGGM
jgi:hypothetical protein